MEGSALYRKNSFGLKKQELSPTSCYSAGGQSTNCNQVLEKRKHLVDTKTCGVSCFFNLCCQLTASTGRLWKRPVSRLVHRLNLHIILKICIPFNAIRLWIKTTTVQWTSPCCMIGAVSYGTSSAGIEKNCTCQHTVV